MYERPRHAKCTHAVIVANHLELIQELRFVPSKLAKLEIHICVQVKSSLKVARVDFYGLLYLHESQVTIVLLAGYKIWLGLCEHRPTTKSSYSIFLHVYNYCRKVVCCAV